MPRIRHSVVNPCLILALTLHTGSQGQSVTGLTTYLYVPIVEKHISHNSYPQRTSFFSTIHTQHFPHTSTSSNTNSQCLSPPRLTGMFLVTTQHVDLCAAVKQLSNHCTLALSAHRNYNSVAGTVKETIGNALGST